MMRTTWVWLLGTILLCALVACTSGGGGGGDDDDDDIDIGGDGDADLDGDSDSDSDGDSDSDSDSDSDGDGDGDGDYECGPDDPNQDPPENDPLCDAPCENVVEICAGATIDYCTANCGALVRSMEGACLDAYRAYIDCVTGATECTEEDGPRGCDTQLEAAGTACANGCVDIINCMRECPQNDQACLQACFDDGTQSGQAALSALDDCARTHCGDIPTNDEDCVGQCLDANCLDETRACR